MGSMGSQDLPEVIHVEPGAWRVETDGKMMGKWWESLRITFENNICSIQLAIDWCISHFWADPDSLSLCNVMLLRFDRHCPNHSHRIARGIGALTLRHYVQLSVHQALESPVWWSQPSLRIVATACAMVSWIVYPLGFQRVGWPICFDHGTRWHKRMCDALPRTWHVTSCHVLSRPMFQLWGFWMTSRKSTKRPGQIGQEAKRTDRIRVLLPCGNSELNTSTNPIQSMPIFLIWHQFRSFPGSHTEEIGRTTEVPWQKQNHSIFISSQWNLLAPQVVHRRRTGCTSLRPACGDLAPSNWWLINRIQIFPWIFPWIFHAKMATGRYTLSASLSLRSFLDPRKRLWSPIDNLFWRNLVSRLS